ncbi:sulfotransferase family 2 domain-containing protein [Altericroceibacterium xinjiangense]|uniref:sulfotransferase family 2 domain-containing protein n=1 Tax=Altericroceibacterium xinjiangense TaxID=762261 RepID=UPI0019D1970C|nr:sulfotransferase family 2 domain-containing protein [Altericroceibacterium xinjiangense]
MRTEIDKRAAYGSRRYVAGLFGAKLVSDIPERLCEIGVRPILDAKRRARLECIRDAGVLFIHVPKNAGMSICTALYGRQMKHATVRYYAKVAPSLLSEVESVAVIRDPVERFLSAFDYARAGGSGDNLVSAPFRSLYTSFRSLDDALDHIAQAKSPYRVDHIFRPQSWYVLDRSGCVAVNRLIRFDRLGEDDVLLGAGGAGLPQVNQRKGSATKATPAQERRIRNLYRRDASLFEGLSGSGAA